VLLFLSLLLLPGCRGEPPFPRPLPPALAAEAAQELAALAAARPPGDPAEGQLAGWLEDRARLELAQLAGQAAVAPLLAAATRRSQEGLGELLVRRGPQAYQALAARQVVQQVAALGQDLPRLGAVLDPTGRAGQAGVTDAPPARVRQYGSFLLGVARPSGLVDVRGRPDPDLLPYARAILLYRLLAEPARLRGRDLPLPPATRQVFLRWKVERATLASPAARRAALAELQGLDPTYPAAAARAWLARVTQADPAVPAAR